MAETTTQTVIIGIAIWLLFGGLSKIDTKPVGAGIVGPSISIACRGKSNEDSMYSMIA